MKKDKANKPEEAPKHRYAMCECGEEMVPGGGCKFNVGITADGEIVPRLRHGKETRFDLPEEDNSGTNCHDCNAAPGKFHHLGCDWEECPVCHGQALRCECLPSVGIADEEPAKSKKEEAVKEFDLSMDLYYRNEVGRLVLHAEETKGLPQTTPEMVEAMFPDDFKKQKEYLEKRLEEIGGPAFTPAWFAFDEGPAWLGVHDGSTWNGWAKPYFTKEVADQIIEFFNQSGSTEYANPEEAEKHQSYYDPEKDGYFLGWELEEMGEGENKDDYLYGKNEKNGLYGVGSGSLTWNLLTEEEATERNSQ